MNKRARFVKMCISLIIIFTLLVTNVSAYGQIDIDFYLNDNQIHTGKVVPSGSAEAAFADEIDYDSLANFQFQQELTIADDDISVNLLLNINSSEIQLNYDGKLYRSFRYTDAEPVYIGVFDNGDITENGLAQVDDQVANYEIIYFEISNGKSPYNLDKDLRDTPSLTIYLRTAEGTILDLGSQIDSPIILDGINDQAPSDNDISWFLNYINGTYSERQTEYTRSVKNALWTGDTHTLRYQIGDYEHRYEAIPYVEIFYKDIPFAGEMDFSMNLKITESHRYREVGDTTWTFDRNEYTKCFGIDNAELAWTAGGNTGITYATPRVKSPSEEPDDFSFLGVVAFVTGCFPQTTPISQIATAAQLILEMNTGTETQFNGNFDGSLPGVRSYKVTFPEDYYIEENGYGLDNPSAERFELTVTMTVMDHNAETNYYTAAVASFKFRIYWASLIGGSGQKEYGTDDDTTKIVYYYNNVVPAN